MEFFKQNTQINFMGARKVTALISVIFIIGTIITLLVNGLNWGLDFTGGTQIEVNFPEPVDLVQVRSALTDAGFTQSQAISYGTSRDILISIAPQNGVDQSDLVNQIVPLLPPSPEVLRVDYVGPQVGQELAVKGALAVIVAMIATMIYIALRFEYRFAVSAMIALVHDPLLIIGIFSLFHIEFDLVALAALLAVVGYSLNDTIVVFDRVRENFRKIRHGTAIEIMNLSINQTLSRTIITSALTLFVVIALFIYGGATIRGFSLALMIGIIIGTYSSIYIAGATAVTMGLRRTDLMPKIRKEVDDRP